MANTPTLAVPEWSASQASPWLIHNKALRMIEAMTGYGIVEDRDLSSPPGSCASGARYLINGTGGGAWIGHDGELAIAVGVDAASGWYFITVAQEGVRLYVRDENVTIKYLGGWVLTDDALDANSVTYSSTDPSFYAATVEQALDELFGLLSPPDLSGYAVRANNLSDLTDAAAARLNLGIDASTIPFDPADDGFYAATVEQALDELFSAVAIAGGSVGALLAANNLSDVANAVTAGANIKPIESFIIAVSDESTALTIGTAKVTFRLPYAFTITAVRSNVVTAPTGSTLIVDINEAGASILSTKLSIDASEKTSTTAASAAVISDASIADDAEMTIDIDQIGSTIAGAGLKVTIIGHRT